MAAPKVGVGIGLIPHLHLDRHQLSVITRRTAEAQDVALRTVAVPFGQLCIGKGHGWRLAIDGKAHGGRLALGAAPVSRTGAHGVCARRVDRDGGGLHSLFDPLMLGKADRADRCPIEQDHDLLERLIGLGGHTNRHSPRAVHDAARCRRQDRCPDRGHCCCRHFCCGDDIGCGGCIGRCTAAVDITGRERTSRRWAGGPDGVGVDQRVEQRQVGELRLEDRIVVEALHWRPLPVAGTVEAGFIELEVHGPTGVGDLIPGGIGRRVQIGLAGGPPGERDPWVHHVDHTAPGIVVQAVIVQEAVGGVQIDLVDPF